jgi:hypothetical protein
MFINPVAGAGTLAYLITKNLYKQSKFSNHLRVLCRFEAQLG